MIDFCFVHNLSECGQIVAITIEFLFSWNCFVFTFSSRCSSRIRTMLFNDYGFPLSRRFLFDTLFLRFWLVINLFSPLFTYFFFNGNSLFLFFFLISSKSVINEILFSTNLFDGINTKIFHESPTHCPQHATFRYNREILINPAKFVCNQIISGE